MSNDLQSDRSVAGGNEREFRGWRLGRIMTQTLVIAHVIGLMIATVFAWHEIRSIVWSGPILTLTGLTIALISYRKNRPAGLYFGLAAPTVAVICFSLICGLQWSTDEALVPVGMVLTCFSAICILTIRHAFREISRSRQLEQVLPLQFGIGSLLWAMFFVALFFGFVRSRSSFGVAVIMLVAYLLFAWRLVWNLRIRQVGGIDADGVETDPQAVKAEHADEPLGVREDRLLLDKDGKAKSDWKQVEEE